MPARILPVLLLCVAAAAPARAEFSIGFEWGDIPLCTTGQPTIVDSPAFVIEDLPEGTQSVEFRLKDLDVPNYNHGGQRLRLTRGGTLPAGAFSYKSPCPPAGSHSYEWSATARDGSGVLGRATATRRYPE